MSGQQHPDLAGFSNAYPADIKPLTALRFAAAAWVLLFFFGDRLGLGWREASGLVAKGYLGVDLFFILSGFILTHVYGPAVIAGRFSFKGFLWARLARLYPVHLVTLVSLVLLALIAGHLGLEISEAFDYRHLWAQILLVQAWGVVPGGGWNHPSWSISAEWFAYLVFPLAFGALAFGAARPRLALSIAIGMFILLYLAAPYMPFANGAGLTDFTQFGAIRIIPSFATGIALWWLGQKVTLGRSLAWAGVAASLAAIVLASFLRLSDIVIWTSLAGLIFTLAELSKIGGGGPLAAPLAIWLGEASYALYMVHMPVDLVWFQLVRRVVSNPNDPTVALVAVIGVILASLLAAGLLYTYIERPARAWLRANAPFKK